MRAMRTSKAFLLIAALCTAVPSLKGQVPVNADPNQQPGLQKFFLVPESVLAQIPHQDKVIPIPQNIVSTPPATVGGQPTFHAVQNSHQNPSRVALTPQQAEYAKKQEAFRNEAIEANRKAAARRKEQERVTSQNQFSQTPAGQFAQNDQFFDNQQANQVHSQVQPDGFRNVQAQTPTRRVKPAQRQKASQAVVQGQNQVSQQPRVHHHQSQQPRVQQQQFQQPQVQQQQQFQQPQVQQQQFQQPQQQQFQQQQQQQFAPSAQAQFQQPQQAPAAVQRQAVQQPAAPPTSFISTESQRRPVDVRSQAVRDEDEIIRHQAENAKYSFSSAVNDGINDQQHIRQETRDGLKLAGLYSYSDGFYKRTIHYEADENGYRVVKPYLTNSFQDDLFSEEVEPIGNGPNADPSGIAEVSSDVGGASLRYSISGQDFPPQTSTGNAQDVSNNFQRI
ncbi:hypothetical protein LSTR_LSTR002775 [Laodelphax striatellus]|uniref:Uncharacterized protein n=1 Tax=Laodelphax striatellus TaxID=195883 RepID=A0A482WMI5_LAOST|nr:hypothetical protein LSTR_LSTR002775 [Laodelphax striatellus]